MKLALLISGRATRYEVGLLPLLEKIDTKKYSVDLFMSINDTLSPYYTTMEKNLSRWLKGINYEIYQIPDDFINNNGDWQCTKQLINGVWVPRNQLSMYYNDTKAFNLAVEYQNKNNFKYDVFMKTRPDIITENLPDISKDENKLIIHSIFPLCHFIGFGVYNKPIISAAWDWGNYESMKIYCETYEYVLAKNKELNNNYLIHYESGVTDNLYSKNIPYDYTEHFYRLDANRRIFDLYPDSRNQRLSGSVDCLDIKSVTELNIDPVPIVFND